MPDIQIQAEALAPVLRAARGQRVMLVGQSYGAAIAALMAAANPGRVDSLVLLSGFFGEAGPTARRLIDLGSKALGLIPRDLRHAVIEAAGQTPQLPLAHRALGGLRIPIHMVHGDRDDFAPFHVAERVAVQTQTRRPIRFVRAAGATHFLNDGPAHVLLATLEGCIPARRRWLPDWLRPAKFQMPRLRSPEVREAVGA